jgi:hypothetical protein
MHGSPWLCALERHSVENVAPPLRAFLEGRVGRWPLTRKRRRRSPVRIAPAEPMMRCITISSVLSGVASACDE